MHDDYDDQSLRLRLRWVEKMRWVMFATLVAVTFFSVDGSLPRARVTALIGIFSIVALTNVGLRVFIRRPLVSPQHTLGGVWAALLVDAACLTGVLAFTGGPHNPFTTLYLVHVAMASVVLPTVPAVVIGLASGGFYAALFILPLPELPGTTMQSHMRGMWVAFSLSMAFIVAFVGRLAATLRDRERALFAARLSEARATKLAALGALAGGAAHELNTPLSTIAVVADELVHALDTDAARTAERDDAALILREIERCRSVLGRLSVDAGAALGEQPRPLSLAQWCQGAVRDAFDDGRIVLELQDGDEDSGLVVPHEAFRQALRALVQNAIDASPDNEPVEICAGSDTSQQWVRVSDRGTGIAADIVPRLGEPFVTSKGGMGLGVFLAHALLERFSGTLRFLPRDGGGTVAEIVFPIGQQPAGQT